MCAKTQGRIANHICRPRQDLRGSPLTCCLWNASDIIFKGITKVNPQISFSPKKFPQTREKGPGKNLRFFPILSPEGERKNFNHFRRGVYVAKIPRPARPWGAHTSDRHHWWWDGSEGSLLPSESPQISFAVFIFTPGPMVEAATQLRIYWPLAAAGLALTMAPMRAL